MDPPGKKRKTTPSLVPQPTMVPTVVRKGLNKSVTTSVPCEVPVIATRSREASSSSGSASIGPAPEGLQNVMEDIFLVNKLSARDVARIARGGQTSGAAGVGTFAKAGGGGKHPQNMARDMMRALLKKTTMPETTWFDVRCWCTDTKAQIVVKLPFLLPHLVACEIYKDTSHWKVDKEKAPQIWDAFVKTCQTLGLDPDKCMPIGMHGDGVPFTKKQSLEVISWNVLGESCNDRIPFTGISKAFTCKCGCQGRDTWDDVMEIFSWSIKSMVMGTHPSVDHKGQPLPKQLRLLAGQPLGLTGVLCQIRGDWPFLKGVFGVPAWNSLQCCWMCKAVNIPGEPLDFRNPASNAPWRETRETTQSFFDRLREMGVNPSPLFHCPGLSLEHIVLDWLHINDLGVSQDVAGNVFAMAIGASGLPGRNQEERLHCLWTKLKVWYKKNSIPVRLDDLTLEMFYGKGSKPNKLRAKGGETRQLVPFLAEFAQEMSHVNETWAMVARLCHELHQCAKEAASTPFVPEKLASSSRKVCALWANLAAAEEARGNFVTWKIKPKFHLFQELCEYKSQLFGSPELFWCYMDESWCGFMAKSAKRRGGSNPIAAVPERLLNRFRAMQG